MSFSFTPILVDSVISTLKNLKASKSKGLDKIPAKILKYIAPPLTVIFNLSLSTGIYIDKWKHARVYLRFLNLEIDYIVKLLSSYFHITSSE